MKKPKTRITDKLDALASRMVDRTLENEISLDMQVKVFTALTGYYSAQAKAKKLDEDEGEKLTFNRFRTRVAAAEKANGGEGDG